MDRCRPNHDDVDYRLAELTLSRAERDRLIVAGRWNEKKHSRRLLRARAAYHFSTYWFYVTIWAAPPIVGLALWLVVPSAAPA